MTSLLLFSNPHILYFSFLLYWTCGTYWVYWSNCGSNSQLQHFILLSTAFMFKKVDFPCYILGCEAEREGLILAHHPFDIIVLRGRHVFLLDSLSWTSLGLWFLLQYPLGPWRNMVRNISQFHFSIYLSELLT